LGTQHPFISIPPGQKEFKMESTCPSSCTGDATYGIPSKGITVLTYAVHMHRRGIAGYTQVVRNGQELEPLTRMNYFDFNYQNVDYVPPQQQKLLPGDRLITTCVWDSSQDTTTIKGGISSEEEMCINFVEYYPAIPLFSCTQLSTSAFSCVKQYSNGQADSVGSLASVTAAKAGDLDSFKALNNSLVNKCFSQSQPKPTNASSQASFSICLYTLLYFTALYLFA
jgi:hypothetical protein